MLNRYKLKSEKYVQLCLERLICVVILRANKQPHSITAVFNLYKPFPMYTSHNKTSSKN